MPHHLHAHLHIALAPVLFSWDAIARLAMLVLESHCSQPRCSQSRPQSRPQSCCSQSHYPWPRCSQSHGLPNRVLSLPAHLLLAVQHNISLLWPNCKQLLHFVCFCLRASFLILFCFGWPCFLTIDEGNMLRSEERLSIDIEGIAISYVCWYCLTV